MRSELRDRRFVDLRRTDPLSGRVRRSPGQGSRGSDFIAYPLSPDAARELAATLTAEADTADGPLRRHLARDDRAARGRAAV